MSTHDLLAIERAAWDALSSGGATAARFYEDGLAAEVLMVLPGGMVIDDREQVIEAMRGEPWSSFELFEERVLPLAAGSAAVAYRARARRGDHEYHALFTSTYVLEDGAWRLALHQQTPID